MNSCTKHLNDEQSKMATEWIFWGFFSPYHYGNNVIRNLYSDISSSEIQKRPVIPWWNLPQKRRCWTSLKRSILHLEVEFFFIEKQFQNLKAILPLSKQNPVNQLECMSGHWNSSRPNGSIKNENCQNVIFRRLKSIWMKPLNQIWLDQLHMNLFQV